MSSSIAAGCPWRSAGSGALAAIRRAVSPACAWRRRRRCARRQVHPGQQVAHRGYQVSRRCTCPQTRRSRAEARRKWQFSSPSICWRRRHALAVERAPSGSQWRRRPVAQRPVQRVAVDRTHPEERRLPPAPVRRAARKSRRARPPVALVQTPRTRPSAHPRRAAQTWPPGRSPAPSPTGGADRGAPGSPAPPADGRTGSHEPARAPPAARRGAAPRRIVRPTAQHARAGRVSLPTRTSSAGRAPGSPRPMLVALRQPHRVGRPVAGPREPRRIHERLRQQHRMTVRRRSRPMPPQPGLTRRQVRLRTPGKIRIERCSRSNAPPRPLLRRPADPLPRGQLVRPRAPAQQRHPGTLSAAHPCRTLLPIMPRKPR